MDISKPNIYIAADNIISPLGNTTADNFEQLKQNISGIKQHYNLFISDTPIAASLFEGGAYADNDQYTKFEQLIIASVSDALSKAAIDVNNTETGFILSSTKGNISLLETAPHDDALQKRISLVTSAQLIVQHFGFVCEPIIISNACISGVMALITAMRLIQTGQYKHVVVSGADVISKFVVSGFQSFQALSAEQCKPFDKNRTGLNLGEAAATIILSADQRYEGNIRISGGGISNDANHISGPSRTGQELADAINKALFTAGLAATDIGLISAHGTATPYNDEMEAKALTLTGLGQVPLHGIKAAYGHTLGAAGLIEGIIAAGCMRQNLLLPTLGFSETGTLPLNVNTEQKNAIINHCLKTASGFGGCNGAMVLSK